MRDRRAPAGRRAGRARRAAGGAPGSSSRNSSPWQVAGRPRPPRRSARGRSRAPTARVNRPPLIPIRRWIRQPSIAMPHSSSACCQAKTWRVDGVDERAVEVEDQRRHAGATIPPRVCPTGAGGNPGARWPRRPLADRAPVERARAAAARAAQGRRRGPARPRGRVCDHAARADRRRRDRDRRARRRADDARGPAGDHLDAARDAARARSPRGLRAHRLAAGAGRDWPACCSALLVFFGLWALIIPGRPDAVRRPGQQRAGRGVAGARRARAAGRRPRRPRQGDRPGPQSVQGGAIANEVLTGAVLLTQWAAAVVLIVVLTFFFVKDGAQICGLDPRAVPRGPPAGAARGRRGARGPR